MSARRFSTLVGVEIRRFLSMPIQTLGQPAVTTSLYLLIFGCVVEGKRRVEFIVPGLVMLAVLQSAFANNSSSIFTKKAHRSIVDLLVAPLLPIEIAGGYALAALSRGVLVGLVAWTACASLTDVRVAHPFFAFAFLGMGAILFGSLGLLAAVFSEKVEELGIIQTFAVTPLVYLGGAFYDVNALHAPWRALARANPVSALVEGFRYGLIGRTEPPPWNALVFSGAAAGVLLLGTWAVIAVRYKLRG